MSGFVLRDIGVVRTRRSQAPRGVLNGIDMACPGGKVTVIRGTTGAGKTTLLHVMAVLLRPTRGEVLADGQPVSRWVTAHRDRWRRRVGILFQHPCLFEDRTALENVLVPLIPRGEPAGKLGAQALQALRDLGLQDLAGTVVAALSGGERQRVGAARALVTRPEYVLADEPTAHQDAESAREMLTRLRGACAWGGTVVIAAHDPRILDSGISDVHYELEQGRVKELS